jgi:hypothetical protein
VPDHRPRLPAGDARLQADAACSQGKVLATIGNENRYLLHAVLS